MILQPPHVTHKQVFVMEDVKLDGKDQTVHKVYIHLEIVAYLFTYLPIYLSLYLHMYSNVSVAEWLAWLTGNCGRIGSRGSSPCNGLKPNS